MFETVVVATDGSASAQRAVRVTLDLASRFDATVHALNVVDESEIAATPESVQADLEAALEDVGGEAVEFVREQAEAGDEHDVVTAIRPGDPDDEIIAYAREHDADLVATGTRGRHGEHSFLLGSTAEAVVRNCPVPVLTVRQLEEGEERPRP